MQKNPGTCEVTLGWEGTAGLGTLSPAWIIDEMCGVETGGGSSPICLVIIASAGSRFIGDLRALEASAFRTQILQCQLLLMAGGGKAVYFV